MIWCKLISFKSSYVMTQIDYDAKLLFDSIDKILRLLLKLKI